MDLGKKVVVFGQIDCPWARLFYLGKSASNRAKRLYLGKSVYIRAKLLHLGKSGCTRESGCLRAY